MEKIPYERRYYESVDDRILILRCISKIDGKKVLGCNELILTLFATKRSKNVFSNDFVIIFITARFYRACI